jgi:hypothetical protein
MLTIGILSREIMMAKKKKKEKTHQASKVTVKYKPKNRRGWEEDGSGDDGYDQVCGYSVSMYDEDGYYSTTEFISEDLHEVKEHLAKVQEVLAYYKNRESKNTILKSEYDHMTHLEEEETYYEKLINDLEKL